MASFQGLSIICFDHANSLKLQASKKPKGWDSEIYGILKSLEENSEFSIHN